MEISIKERDNKGYVVAKEGDKTAGVMTYSIAGADFIIIDHTEVKPGFEGKGIGKELLFKVVDMVREKSLKVIPLCPFANAQFKKIDDIKDVLKS